MHAFNARQVNVGTKIVGAGFNHAKERARITGLGAPQSDHDADPVASLVKEGRRLVDRSNTLLNGSLESLPSINERPQRSAGMRMLIAIPGFRGFKPKPAIDLIKQDPAYRGSAAAPNHRGQAQVADPRQRQSELLEQMQSLSDAHHRADQDFAEKRAALDQAKATHLDDSPVVQAAQRDHDKALATLEKATEKLDNAVTVSHVLETHLQVLAVDLIDQKVSFVHAEVQQQQERLRDMKGSLGEVVSNLNQQRSQLVGVHQDAVVALAGAVHQRGQAQTALAAATDALPQHPDEKQQAALDPLRKAVSDADRHVAAQTAQVAKTQHAIDDLAPYFEQQLHRLGEQSQAVEASLKSLEAPGQQLKARAEQAATRLDGARELETRLSQSAVNAVANLAPGFNSAALASNASGGALRHQLNDIAQALPPEDPSAERELPRVAVLELLSRGLAGACDGDVGRARQLLTDLRSRPLDQWIAPPAGATAADGAAVHHEAPSADMQRLLRGMAQVPRGGEVLNLVASQASTQPGDEKPAALGRGQMEAQQAYWMAHRAQAQETDPAVKTWLGDAMKVAQHEVRNPKGETVFDTADLPPKQMAAYNAVKNGFLSNAAGSDYALTDRNLQKVGGDWVRNAQDDRHALLRVLPKSINPSKGKTPYEAKTVTLAQKQMEAQGMSTTKTVAEGALQAAAAELSTRARQGVMRARPGQADNADARRYDATLEAIGQHLSGHHAAPTPLSRMAGTLKMKTPEFHQTKRLYDAQLGPKDVAEIRARVQNILQPPEPQQPPESQRAGPNKLSKPHRNPVLNPTDRPLPPSIEALFQRTPLPVTDLLKALHADMAADPQAAHPALAGLLTALNDDFGGGAGIDAKVDNAKLKRLDSAEDVKAFFTPMLQDLRLRDQVAMSGGGVKGIGIPFVPWTPMPPILMSASADLHSKKDEAAIQFKSPTFAAEIKVEESTARTRNIKGTLGLGVDLGVAKLTAPSVSAKYESSKGHAVSTTVRTLRDKDDLGVRKEQDAIDHNLAVLDTLLRWDSDDKQPKTAAGQVDAAQKFSGPLEALLALHPKALVASGERDVKTSQLGLDLSVAARLGFGDGYASMGVAFNPVTVKAEKTLEQSTERTGYAHQTVHDRSDQRRQRMAMTGGVSGALSFFKKPVDAQAHEAHDDRKGSVRVAGATNLLDISREIASNFEKNGATRFPIGDRVGGAVDRSYGSPKDLLAEIDQHREEFLMRCLDTLPRAKDAPMDTPERRLVAHDMLRQFEADLHEAKDHPNLQFNIKYEMQPRMSGLIDALRGVEAQAMQAGDKATAQEARDASQTLLSYRSSWAVKNAAIRNKGKDSSETGVDFVGRWQRTHGAETSRALAAFPG
ncbi:hypothetical protein [Roseateles sp. L2-2]|uniref:hypothetical protein n=1 Tax=Roseateles sp. L2-2 TaxID=3422597 RepID=UPI003D36931E